LCRSYSPFDFKYPFHTDKINIIWQRINVDYFPAPHRLIEQLIFFTGSFEPKTEIRSAFGVYCGSKIHCVLDFHRSLAETHQALRVKPPLSPRGLKICDQILAMAPHALLYLVTSAIRPPGSLDLAARHKDLILEDIQVFLGICEVLSNCISQSNPPCQQEAALREEYLHHSLRLDVELLMKHLVTFSKEATELSHANTLHACPAHLQPEIQIDNWQADSVLGSIDSAQSVHVNSSSTLRMTTPPRDMRMGVLDTQSDDCLPFVGSSHPQPSERSMLPQSSVMPPGTSTMPSAPQASTAIP
jgi:hypothetical protein